MSRSTISMFKLCGNCGQPYREHKAFMENCPLEENGEFSTDKYFAKGIAKKNPAAVALGKLGGASKSRKKQAASRKNGKPGGRKAKPAARQPL